MKNTAKLPKYMKKGKTIYKRTKHGSYVDISLDGMAQQKNAESYLDLLKAGYYKSNKV